MKIWSVALLGAGAALALPAMAQVFTSFLGIKNYSHHRIAFL
jgi:hypothetical protein